MSQSHGSHVRPCCKHQCQSKPDRRRRYILALGPLAGVIALFWFLIRVIPKPSRAAYPCQRVAAPLATGFVLWMLCLMGTAAAFGRAKHFIRNSKIAAAAMCLLLAAIGGLYLFLHTPEKTVSAENISLTPIGDGKGIYPGRVVWTYAPQATAWDGATGYWWQRGHSDQAVVNTMMSQAVCGLTGEPNDVAAWNALFLHFNGLHGKGGVGYTSGEKIVIKVNLVTSDRLLENVDVNGDQTAGLEFVNTSPQMMIAILWQLTSRVGVPQSDIFIGDTSAYFTNHYWNMCHSLFPNVNYFDCRGTLGRTPVSPSSVPLYWSTPDAAACAPDMLPDCYASAAYIVNFAALKAHESAVTFCAKNHYGSLIRLPYETAGNLYDLHLDLVMPSATPGMGHYRTLVDLMGHSQLGGKTLLYLIDGLWGGYGSTGYLPPIKWNMPPFSGDWPSTLLVSQDPVAIDSVGYDFVWTEEEVSGSQPPYSEYNFAHLPGGDDYLHEAALADNPPSGSVYTPDGNNVHLASLGVHEHWNNYSDKLYSGNMGYLTGVELMRVDVSSPTIPGDLSGDDTVNMRDLAVLASHWRQVNCAQSDWCDGADLDFDGNVSSGDLMVLSSHWLAIAGS
jgi:hypothetical protein